MKQPKTFLALLTTVVLTLLMSFPATAQTEAGQPYVVQYSDSLWKLAEKYLGDGNLYPQIMQATAAKVTADSSFSAIASENVIHPGQKIWIPAATDLPTLPGTSTNTAVVPATTGLPGGHIAFSFWNNAPGRCTYEINIIEVQACLQSPDACQANRRIFTLNNASEPALSPNGEQLAFRGWGGIPDEVRPGQPHPYQDCATPQAERWLQTTTLDGVNRHSMTGFYEDSHPDWSPDGEKVLFDSGRNGDGITRIMMFYADGSGEEELRIAGQQPSWAGDSDRFVYRGCDNTGNRCGLWQARAVPVKSWEAGVNVIGPVLAETDAAHPDWSSTTDTIVYQSRVDGNWNLYLIEADGSNRRQLTDDPAIEGLPVWSPDGQWVAYLSNQGDNWGIWIIGGNGQKSRQLLAFDGGQFTPLAVEPYGSRDWLDEQISWEK